MLKRPIFKKLLLCTLISSSFSALAAEHTMTTKYGDVQIDDQIERVVTLSEDALDSAIALGIKPVGAIATRGSDGVADYIQDKAQGIDIVGTARQSNLEAIVAQRPDVILASARLPEEQYKLLSKIAPTIVPVSPGMTPEAWMVTSRAYAQALNKSDEMNAIINKVKQREDDLKQRVEAKLPEQQREAIIARWMPPGPLVMSPNLFAAGVLTATGFTVSDGDVVKKGRPHSSPLSLENISNIDKDWLFLATLNADGENALQAAQKSAAFSRLNVVKNNHVVLVNGQLWSSTEGPLAAHTILDNIQTMLDQKAP